MSYLFTFIIICAAYKAYKYFTKKKIHSFPPFKDDLEWYQDINN